MTSGSRTLKNITKFKKEMTELEWKIENFRPLIHSLKKEKKPVSRKTITKDEDPCEVIATWKFTAGKDLGKPTDWYLTLHIQENEKKKKVLYLYLGCQCESQITAGFRVTVKSNKNPCAMHYDSGLQYYCIVPTHMWGQNLGELSSILGPSSEYLAHDGSIVFNIHFEMFGDIVNEDVTGTTPKAIRLVEDNSSDVLQDVVTKMLDDPDLSFADVTFTFPKEEGIELKAHKYILAARSSVFQTMFEVEMTEKASGIVVIEDISFIGMKFVVNFVYTGKLMPNGENKEMDWYKFAEDIVHAADKYDLPQLRSYCDCNLIRACDKTNLSLVLDLLKLAILHELKTAAADIAEFLKTNIQDMVAETLGK